MPTHGSLVLDFTAPRRLFETILCQSEGSVETSPGNRLADQKGFASCHVDCCCCYDGIAAADFPTTNLGPGIAANISTPTSVTTLYCGRYIVHNLILSSQLWTEPYDS